MFDETAYYIVPETFQTLETLHASMHMLIMSDECYPGPGTSFGRFDQYLYPYWEKTIEKTFAQEEGRLIEVIQVILEDIKIYFERFLMRGFCHGGQKQHQPRNITRCNVRMR